MKKILTYALAFMLPSLAFSQSVGLQKNLSTDRISASFAVPSGSWVYFEPGSTLSVAGSATLSGLARSGAATGTGITASASTLLGRYSASTGALQEITLGAGLAFNSSTLKFDNPMTTAGDLIVGGTAGILSRVGVGTEGQVLKVVSGVPAWGSASSSSGDVVGPASSVANSPAVFDGTTGKLLSSPTGVAITSTGSIGIGNTSPASRLSVGNHNTAPTGRATYSLLSQSFTNDAHRAGFAERSEVNCNSSSYSYIPIGVYTNYAGTSCPWGFASFADSSIFATSGTIYEVVGYSCEPTVSSGIITSRYGFRSNDSSGGGSVGTAYGFYSGSMTDASTNWAFYAVSNQSYFGGGVKVGGTNGTNCDLIASASAALDFASIAAGASADLTVTVTGASTGDSVSLGLPSAPAAGIIFQGFVSASNTVTVRATNITGSAVDPASATYRATVHSF